MSWLVSRRNQLLLGGSIGALVGGAFGSIVGVEQGLVPVFAGFALGQVLAVITGSRLLPNGSPRRDARSARD